MSTSSPWVIRLIVLVAILVVLVGLFVAIAGTGAGGRLILIALLLFGLYLVVRNAIRLARGDTAAGVELSRQEVTVGEPFTVTTTSGATDGRVDAARLICRESARYRPGGQSALATDAHDWIVQEVSASSGAPDSSVPLELRIPDDAMHSFQSHHFDITWRVEADLNSRNGRTRTIELPLEVLPIVHAPR